MCADALLRASTRDKHIRHGNVVFFSGDNEDNKTKTDKENVANRILIDPACDNSMQNMHRCVARKASLSDAGKSRMRAAPHEESLGTFGP